MCKDDIMGLIEKEIANKEHNEPDDNISSFDVLPIKTKSASVGKETKSTNIASKESLETVRSEPSNNKSSSKESSKKSLLSRILSKFRK